MNISFTHTPADRDVDIYGLQYFAKLYMAHGTPSQSIMAQQIADLAGGDDNDIGLAKDLAEGIVKESAAFISAFTGK